MASDLDTIPHDGSDQIFELTIRLDAFWCDDLRDWILCRPFKAERLPSGARHIGPRVPVSTALNPEVK